MITHLKKTALICWCLFYIAVRGRGRKVSGTLNHIAVFQMAKLGDMVCTTPLFRAIHEAIPATSLTVVGNSINESLLVGSEDITQYVVFRGIVSTRARLLEKKTDVAIVTGPDTASLAVAFLSRAKSIIVPKIVGGYSPLENIPYRFLRWALGAIVVEHSMGTYAPRQYLRLLEPLGVFTEDTTKHLVYSREAEIKAKEFLALHKRPTIGLLPSAGNTIKEWPADRFATVADALVREHGASVIVLGGPRDADAAEAVMSLVKTPLIDTCSKFSLDELKAVIASLDMVVGVDTGPIYIAEAFGVPTVDIVGPMDEKEQPPRGEWHVVAVPPERQAPALHIMNAKPADITEARRQVMAISEEQVIRLAGDLLLKRKGQ